jgi:hypothetical protein
MANKNGDPRKISPLKQKLDNDAQDLVASIGITPMTKDEIAKKYGRTIDNTHYALLRARMFARANGIMIDRPHPRDGYLYRARWEWTDDQRPNWNTVLSDTLTRASGIRQDKATYTGNAEAEGQKDLAQELSDIFDLFKVTERSIAKARLLVESI